MAGNARFHNKYHRANHHTNSSVSIPDSATDPIASPEFPFNGDFVLTGTLSGRGVNFVSGLSANGNVGVSATFTLAGRTYTFTRGILTQVT
jgi:hypothetical protein